MSSHRDRESNGRGRDSRDDRLSRNDREGSRERSRSRHRDRSRERGRSPGRREGRGGRDEHGRDVYRERSPESRVRERRHADRERSRDREEPRRRDRSRSREKDKRAVELDKQERLALVKSITVEVVHPTTSGVLIPSKTTKTSNGEEEDPEEVEREMMRMMGFGSFDSTKGKPVDDNFETAAAGGAKKNKERVYRQYMNRRGGFNKPLAKMP